MSLVARRGVSFAACVCLYVCLRWVCKRIIAAYATCEREEVADLQLDRLLLLRQRADRTFIV